MKDVEQIKTPLDEGCRANKNTFYVQELFLRKLWDNMEKYGTAGQATDDTIIRCIRIAFWINKVTNTHSEYVTLIAFPR